MRDKNYIKFLLIIFCLLPFSTFAKELQKPKFLDIQVVKDEKSNITAWLVEDHSIPVIAMSFSFRGAGAKNDPIDKQGLARLTSNTMDEGAGDLTSQEFQKTLRDMSISLSFSASRDNFSGALKTLSQNKEKAFELLKLALTKPRFDEEPVGRMRDSNKSRIKSSLSNPRWIAARIQNDRLFEGHPYAMNSGGTLSSLDKITSDDLRKFHKTLGKNQLVIGVAGDINAKELKKIINYIFSDLPDVKIKETKKYPLQNAGKTYIYKRDIPQSIIAMAQKGISRDSKDYYAATLMNFILGESGFGSRLMEEIREKRGLTYGIYSYFRRYDEADTLNVSTSTVNKNVKEMISLIYKEWDKMKSEPVSKEEINDAKSYIIGSLPLSLTSTDSIAGILLSLQLEHLPVDYLDMRAEKINSVTIDDILSVSKRILDKDSITTVIVGAPKGIKAEVITDIPNVE